MPQLIDLNHLGRSRVIASYLLPGDEPALVDCGPSTCVGALESGLAERGLGVSDLRHVLLTHVHLDHAGAAGTLVRQNPDLLVHVSEIGAPHLVDPSRLETSARRVFGEDYDRLWGEIVPVPEANLRIVGSRVGTIECFPTPGHASHHVTFVDPEGACYSGDVTGVRIAPSTYCAPPTVPPEVDLEAWQSSLDAIEKRAPTRFFLPHFGPVQDVYEHLALVRQRLAAWSERVRVGLDERAFVRAADEELDGVADEEAAAAYRLAAPSHFCFRGLERYWRRRGEVGSEA